MQKAILDVVLGFSVMLAAPEDATQAESALAASACDEINQKVERTQSKDIEAADVQKLIAPLALACSKEISSSLEQAATIEHRARLKALDSLSFYFNATSEVIPFSPPALAALIIDKLDPGHSDGELKTLLKGLHEENRSHQWMQNMGLDDNIHSSYRSTQPSGQVATLTLKDGHLKTHTLDLREMDMVVVAGCHIAQHAAETLRDDPEAQRLMSGMRVVWMEPVGRSLDLDELQRWNAAFPEHPMHVALRNAQWTGMDLTALPTFHLLKNGKVVASHRGWSRDGATPIPLLDALRSFQER